jgi:hypothetical protein
VTALEQEIDQLVYALYGLGEEKIADAITYVSRKTYASLSMIAAI